MNLDMMLTHAPATLLLLISIAGFSFLGFRNPALTARCLLHPWVMFRQHQYERLLLSGFLHADLMHLLFNLIALYAVSMHIEVAVGTTSFLFIYFGSLLLSGLPVAIRRRNSPEYRALGASGAVSGLFFAGMLYFPEAKVMLLFLPIPMPWPVFALLFIVASMYGAKKKWDAVAHDVHLYGAAAGFVLALMIEPSSLGNLLRAIGLGS